MEKFNYQIVFKVNEDVRIIFAGVTSHSINDVIEASNGVLEHGLAFEHFNSCICENFIYQPLKSDKNES